MRFCPAVAGGAWGEVYISVLHKLIRSEGTRRGPGPVWSGAPGLCGRRYSPVRRLRPRSRALREAEAARRRRRRPLSGTRDAGAGSKPWVGPGRPALGGGPGQRGSGARLAGSIFLTPRVHPVFLRLCRVLPSELLKRVCQGWWLAEGLALFLSLACGAIFPRGWYGERLLLAASRWLACFAVALEFFSCSFRGLYSCYFATWNRWFSCWDAVWLMCSVGFVVFFPRGKIWHLSGSKCLSVSLCFYSSCLWNRSCTWVVCISSFTLLPLIAQVTDSIQNKSVAFC